MRAARLAIPVGRRGLGGGSVRCSHPIGQLAARPHCNDQGRAPCPRRGFATASAASASPALRGLLRVSDEVADAVQSNKPVVALESTIYTHGAMGKDLAREHEDLVRSHGGIPAIIAIVDGVPTVGVSPKQIIRMIEDEGTVKASRRDIAYLAGMVSLLRSVQPVIGRPG